MPVLSEAQVITDLLLCKLCKRYVSRPKGYTRQRHAVCDLGHFFALLVTPTGGQRNLPDPAAVGRLSHSQLQSVWVSLRAWPAVPLLQARRERSGDGTRLTFQPLKS